ncbi:HAMP domain-containing sensor histidine kinase [uncultured Bacteroides sp.]|uniref:sensor histidine kinase n=1 Tax=uncultured Bacteroides sp. TaxID=162156 RepID=UPI002625B8A3|nr:HAMP domain-containing sensor histidine kinase [uncultured Bacteroides sp.]
MKLPFRLIATLVLISLTGTFAYQAYWLTGLYGTMTHEMEKNIHEAMRMSDYREMMLRIKKMQRENGQHGSVEVQAGYEAGSENPVVSRDIKDDEGNRLRKDTLAPEESSAMLRSDNGLALILHDQGSTQALAGFIQRGIHSGIDLFSSPDITVYDSLLTIQLQEYGIRLPHRLEYFRTHTTPDSSQVFVDTLGRVQSAGYLPSKKAVRYDYTLNMSLSETYRLTMEPVDGLILKQMGGILATSLVILLILGFTFGYLVRTILRQKTLEEMKSDFTNNITHELKTPIAVAYAANDALLHFGLAEDRQQREKYLGICQEQLQRLGGLVEQILSMSMERRKSFRLHPERICLKTLFPTLIEQHRLKAGKPVEVALDIEPEELVLTADRIHLSNILSNLMDNAIKYSPAKAEIGIRCRKTESGQVEIAVSDHGTGIPADKLPHVFDKFYRVPTGNVHNTKGYGLGLFYVKTMTEKHNGNVSVKSEPGKGSTFTIRI